MLPIGGLKEKVLAAHRAGITKVIIPAENEKDLDEIPENVKKKVEIVTVDHMDKVLEYALVRLPKPLDTDNKKGAEDKNEDKEG